MDYATLLRDHVTLTCRSVDRIFLQAYVPQLQTPGWVCRFLLYQRHFGFASGLALGKVGDQYLADIRRWAKANNVPIHYFQKGESKEAYARPLIQAAAKEGGDGRVVLLGIAQEKTLCWKSWRAKGQEHAAQPHMEWGRQAAFVNHFYFYLWDPDWGGAFWKTNTYCPWPIWISLNAHEWAKRQLKKTRERGTLRFSKPAVRRFGKRPPGSVSPRLVSAATRGMPVDHARHRGPQARAARAGRGMTARMRALVRVAVVLAAICVWVMTFDRLSRVVES